MKTPFPLSRMKTVEWRTDRQAYLHDEIRYVINDYLFHKANGFGTRVDRITEPVHHVAHFEAGAVDRKRLQQLD